jgi:hypothetical protein
MLPERYAIKRRRTTKLQKMAIFTEKKVIANKNLLAPSNPRSNQCELFSFGIADCHRITCNMFCTMFRDWLKLISSKTIFL